MTNSPVGFTHDAYNTISLSLPGYLFRSPRHPFSTYTIYLPGEYVVVLPSILNSLIVEAEYPFLNAPIVEDDILYTSPSTASLHEYGLQCA